MLGRAEPYVLLDDARPGGAPARLYRAPIRVIAAHTVEEVAPALDAVRAGNASGLHAAGYLAYEAGAAFEPALPQPATSAPLLWFGLFDRWQELPAAEVPAHLPDPAGAWIGEPRPCIDEGAYADAFAEIHALIAAGDLYQANLSFRAEVPFAGDPLALYAALRGNAGAGWGGVVATGTRTLLSFSPELFFSLEGHRLTCRPMKGTARRGATPAADVEAGRALAADPKQRAENLMIVDLMRNDLSRVAAPGSVATPELFAVETYPTIHQMVSVVTAELAPDLDAAHVLTAAFPCGSIVGAPKVRAQQALHAIETGPPRGSYTGSIGRIDGGGDAAFNVAIRTLTIEGGRSPALLGLGSGLVADSALGAEWDECLAKAAFLGADRRRFDLIETMAFDPEEGIALLDRHLERMRRSAELFGFAFDRHAARNELQAATFRLRGPMRVRLLLAPGGAVSVETGPMPPAPPAPVPVAVVPLPVVSRDFRLRHKTTDRGFYDRARRGGFEVLFEDADGYLTEGSFTSLFVPRGDRLLTPPRGRGLLPGVLREALIAEGRAVEADLTAADLAGGFLIGNALRGLIPAVAAGAGASL